jgi:hypothetical protein
VSPFQQRATLARPRQWMAVPSSSARSGSPDQRGQAGPRARQPSLPRLPRQLGLPADHPPRLRPPLLAQAPRPPGGRAGELRQAAPASASSPLPPPSAAPVAGSCSVSRPAIRSSRTSCVPSGGSAHSRGRLPELARSLVSDLLAPSTGEATSQTADSPGRSLGVPPLRTTPTRLCSRASNIGSRRQAQPFIAGPG